MPRPTAAARASRIRSTVRRGRDLAFSIPGAVPVAIVDLVVPYRYDIVIRRRMAEALAAEPVHEEISDERLLDLAETTGYARWFTDVEVALHRPRLLGNASLTRSGLIDRSRRFVALLDPANDRTNHHEVPALEPEGPVVLNWHVGRSHSTSRMPDPFQLSMADGCHRLAIRWQEGPAELAAREYRRFPRLVLPVRDNTARLVGSGAIEADDVLAAFADLHDGFRDALDGRGDGPRRCEFEQWITAMRRAHAAS